MKAAIQVLRGVCLAIGGLLVALGILAFAYGVIRLSFLTETTGLVTTGLPLTNSASPDTRAMFYRYTVNGKDYSGMAFLPLTALQDKAGRLSRTICIF